MLVFFFSAILLFPLISASGCHFRGKTLTSFCEKDEEQLHSEIPCKESYFQDPIAYKYACEAGKIVLCCSVRMEPGWTGAWQSAADGKIHYCTTSSEIIAYGEMICNSLDKEDQSIVVKIRSGIRADLKCGNRTGKAVPGLIGWSDGTYWFKL